MFPWASIFARAIFLRPSYAIRPVEWPSATPFSIPCAPISGRNLARCVAATETSIEDGRGKVTTR